LRDQFFFDFVNHTSTTYLQQQTCDYGRHTTTRHDEWWWSEWKKLDNIFEKISNQLGRYREEREKKCKKNTKTPIYGGSMRCSYDLIEIYAGKRNKSLLVEKELG